MIASKWFVGSAADSRRANRGQSPTVLRNAGTRITFTSTQQDAAKHLIHNGLHYYVGDPSSRRPSELRHVRKWKPTRRTRTASMRNDGERRRHGTAAVHCRPRILRFFSSKTEGHISSLSVDQLLLAKVAIRAIPSVQKHRREQERLASEIYSGYVFGDRPARRRKLEAQKADIPYTELLVTHLRLGLLSLLMVSEYLRFRPHRPPKQ